MSGYTIAFVYDLRSEYLARGFSEEAVAEFDTEETIELIAAALTRLGHSVTRIGNGHALARCLADGCRFDLVFSIAEGAAGRAREAQVPALCELYDQAYVFSDPMTLSIALDKGVAKRLARDAGVRTAAFAVCPPQEAIPSIDFPYPVFAKPIAEGTGKGCELNSVCRNEDELQRTVDDLHRRFAQAVIIEPYLSGREFTVGIVDSVHGPMVAGSLEIVMNDDADAGVYSQRNKEQSEILVSYLPSDDGVVREAEACALAAYKALECRDAGRIDIRCDAAGVAHFLEANPLPGLHPTHSDLPMAAAAGGHSYDWLLNAIVNAAARRCGLAQKALPHRKARALFVPVLHAATPERADEHDTLESAERVAAALERNGWVSDVVRFAPEQGSVVYLARRAPHAIFNLVEAVNGDSAASLLAPWFLETHGLHYTGNSFRTLVTCASKMTVKALLQAARIATPAGADVEPGQQVILKPVWEHASLGIDSASVVPASRHQRALVEREASFDTPFFAEQFIPGREFNLAVLGTAATPRVLPIQETLFVDWPDEQPRVVGYDAKWAADSAAYRGTPRRFGLEAAEPALAHVLTDVARRVWSVFKLSGYARIDVRVGDDGRPLVIDVNPNPGLGPDAGFVATAATAGLDFDALIAALLECAVARRLAA